MDILEFLQRQWKSRRKVIDLLLAWVIKKNGTVVSYRKEAIVPWDCITIRDEETYTVNANAPRGATIILFNKPLGYVVSKSDPHNQTIYDILPQWRSNKYYYMWRLDKDSHGLVVLTDSPALVSYFSHPRYMHEKEYTIRTSSALSAEDIADGVYGLAYTDPDTHEEMILQWQSCRQIWEKTYNVVLHQGKKRHIRRLCDTLGTRAMDLQRNTFGPWKLEGIALGEWASLSLDEQAVENLLVSQNSYIQTQT
jgi:23S rRNA pseudouridine2605 synthase